MDPNTALDTARRALLAFDEATDHYADLDAAAQERLGATDVDAGQEEAQIAQDAVLTAAQDLRDAFGALDDWLAGGGFLPAAWQTVPRVDPERRQAVLGAMERAEAGMRGSGLDVDAEVDQMRGRP